MEVTAKEIRLLWWSMFWRFLLYNQIAYFLIGLITGFFKDFLHDPMIHDLMSQHNIISNATQGAIEALASGISLTQALKIHLPLLLARKA